MGRTLLVLITSLTSTLLVAACAARQAAAQPPARLADEPAVEYTILLTAPQTQMVDVSLTLRGLRPGPIDVALPAWRPGKYAILDSAGAVRGFAARSGNGHDLATEKIDKSTWRITAIEGDDEAVITYRVYCNALGDRTRHADDSHAFLSPSTVLMYAPSMRDKPLTVRIVAPGGRAEGGERGEGWDTATGLERNPRDPDVFIAPNYDVLVDSPLEIGRHERLSFDVDGTPHELVIWNESGLPRTLPEKRITDDLAKIIRAERDVFGKFPYQRYVFLVHALPGGSGGTEHLNSTIMQTSPASFRDEDAFKRFLGLVAHEYFHTWNVKQLRPAGLKPYDYSRENYTDLLWVAEGTTSYLDAVCLVRAGLTRPDDYLRSLGNSIDAIRRRPGAAVQSLHDSSFDAWIAFNRPTPDSVNSTVSFYDKGALVSLLLDMEIRKRSEGKAGLDTVMRDLFERFPLDGPGYTTADLMAAAERASSGDPGSFAQFFADNVSSTRPLDFESALAVAGLDLKQDGPRAAPRRNRNPDPEEPDDTPAEKKDGSPYLGFSVEAKDGLASVTAVLADGPAYAAGLIAGDLVLAIDGIRLRPTDLDARIRQLKPGQPVRLTISRYDHLRDLDLKADARNDARWTISRKNSPDDAEKAVYKAWLGQDWPATPARRRPRGQQEP